MIRAVRSLATERDRESEFKAEAEAADLLGLLDQADRELDEHLAALTVADLIELRPRGDRPPRPGLDWLLSNYGHAREHLEQGDDGQEDHEPGAGVDVPAGHRPPLPTQPLGHARTKTGVEERPDEQGDERDGRDDHRHQQLRPKLDELKEEEEVPV